MIKPARIFRPAKTAMQSGRAKSRSWILEFEPAAAKRPDALMGWAGSSDTQGQVQLHFASKEEAVTYADRHGIEYEICLAQSMRVRPKAYADNFKFDRIR